MWARRSSSSCRTTAAARTRPSRARCGFRRPPSARAAAAALAARREVDYVVITAGSFDVRVEAVCEDDDHLLELVGRRIRALPGVRNTETFVYIKLRKHDQNMGNTRTDLRL